jgi:septal ring-binding cell division protein DamX
VRSEVFVPSPPPSRPSKEDLAALDDLLNSSSLEGPLTPLDKGATMDRGAPTFARSGGGRRVPDSRRGPMLLMLAAVLLAVAAGGWFYRNRLPGRLGRLASATADPTPPAAKPLPTTLSPVVTLPAAEASPAATPIAPVAVPATLRPAPASMAPAATLPPPTTTTTLRPAPAATPRPTVAAAPAGDARALLRGARYPEAARAFAASVRGAGKGAAVVQLLIACSTETIQKAVDNASAPELLILPVNFKGRECYRLCWGLYSSESRASSAVRTVPEYFRNGGATPKVLGVSEVAP